MALHMIWKRKDKRESGLLLNTCTLSLLSLAKHYGDIVITNISRTPRSLLLIFSNWMTNSLLNVKWRSTSKFAYFIYTFCFAFESLMHRLQLMQHSDSSLETSRAAEYFMFKPSIGKTRLLVFPSLLLINSKQKTCEIINTPTGKSFLLSAHGQWIKPTGHKTAHTQLELMFKRLSIYCGSIIGQKKEKKSVTCCSGISFHML